MKVLAHTKRKVYIAITVIVLVFFSALASAFASETVLSTTVPSQLQMQVEIVGKGAVDIVGVRLTQSGSINVNRHEEVSALIEADKGYCLDSVIYNNENVTSKLHEQKLTIAEVEKDSLLKVTFSEKENGIAQTGDNIEPLYAYLAVIASMVLAIMLLAKEKKKL